VLAYGILTLSWGGRGDRASTYAMMVPELVILTCESPLMTVPLADWVVVAVIPLTVEVTVRVPSGLSMVVALILVPVFSQIRNAATPIWMMMNRSWMSQKGIRTRLCQGRPPPCSMY